MVGKHTTRTLLRVAGSLKSVPDANCPVSSSALDHEACRASGYSNQLSCSTCIELKKYRLAVLQESYFLTGSARDRFPNLDVNYKPGSKPTISLLDNSKVVKETFSMEGWDFDTIVEFLRDRLA
ncbi:unnamed protein product [Protopolystoma xenopodis]|uniref:Selenoprotein F n=1 Tax=Protopolystoma xenopodis TaxID=117903 RepID=A0A3S5AEC7_9PLAT|nr:unnamed protein product [Protopolystoma xenopodis]